MQIIFACILQEKKFQAQLFIGAPMCRKPLS